MGFIALNLSLEMIAALRPLVRKIRRHDRPLADQLMRAASSVALNVAEGGGSHAGNQKARYFTALGSASESVAALQVAVAWGYLSSAEIAPPDPRHQILQGLNHLQAQSSHLKRHDKPLSRLPSASAGAPGQRAQTSSRLPAERARRSRCGLDKVEHAGTIRQQQAEARTNAFLNLRPVPSSSRALGPPVSRAPWPSGLSGPRSLGPPGSRAPGLSGLRSLGPSVSRPPS